MQKKPAPPYVHWYYSLWACAVLLLVGLFSWALFFANPPHKAAALLSLPQKNGEQWPLADVSPFVPAAPFDTATASHTLTVFATQGMQQGMDAEPVILYRPWPTRLVAQLIERGEPPTVVTQGVTLSYTLSQPHSSTPQQGTLEGAEGFYTSPDLELSPYTTQHTFNPYPVAHVEARNAKGELLAETKLAVGVSTAMGCHTCHSGSWKTGDRGGLAQATAEHILAAHDRHNKTDLLRKSKQGKAAECRSCHGQQKDLLNLSAAVHGLHATMGLQGAQACITCHPGQQASLAQDFHTTERVGLTCVSCHGPMEDHALSLLRAEAALGKPKATRRIEQISPVQAPTAESIVPRAPWKNLPDCAGCHDFTSKPHKGASAFNKWTQSEDDLFSHRTDDTTKLRCPSCHGAPHALYPAETLYKDGRANAQPLQYQKIAKTLGAQGNCGVCHLDPVEISVHHPLVE